MFSDNVLIGLDIGTHSIKMVEVKNTSNGKELLTFGMAYHSVNLESYWDSTRLRQLSMIIDEIIKTNNFIGVRTVMSVMSRDVYVTTMDFDANWDKKKIQAEIEKQAPYFLPYPPDEMRLSWRLIEQDEAIAQYTGKQRVSINALPDFIIENSKNLLEHINLDGVALENQSVSQIRSTLFGDRGNTILVDIGAHQTTFNIVVDGVLRSSSHIPMGSEYITKDLSDSLGIETQIAEYFKRDLHLVNLFQLPRPLGDFYKVLRTELNSFIELNKKVGQAPSKIVFTGGGVYTTGFVEYFNKSAIPIYFASSLRQLRISEDLFPLITPVNNQFSTAIGLAIWSES
jgi:type IV pilus assembly protein PilM